MTQDEIIEMARKCGWDNPATNMMPLYEFAKLVAAKEREECAKVCDGNELLALNAQKKVDGDDLSDVILRHHAVAHSVDAAAIRARGEA